MKLGLMVDAGATGYWEEMGEGVIPTPAVVGCGLRLMMRLTVGG